MQLLLMVKNSKNWIYFISVFVLMMSGCAKTQEFGRVVWGTSTTALERTRVEADVVTYQCAFEDCFQAVLSLARNEDIEESMSIDSNVSSGVFDVFLKDWVKSHIIVMGIAGQIDTTEVGVFFVRQSKEQTRLEIASRSSGAKRKVTAAVLKELDMRFNRVQ